MTLFQLIRSYKVGDLESVGLDTDIKKLLKEKMPQKQYLIDNLPKELDDAPAVINQVDGFNSCLDQVNKVIDEI